MVAIMNATSGSKLRLASKCLPSLPRRSIALLPRTSVPVAHKTIAQASHSSSGPSRFDVLNAAVLATEPQGSSPWAGVKAWLVRIAQTVAIMLVAMALAFSSPSTAEAARSGGRMGGGSFSRGMSSSMGSRAMGSGGGGVGGSMGRAGYAASPGMAGTRSPSTVHHMHHGPSFGFGFFPMGGYYGGGMMGGGGGGLFSLLLMGIFAYVAINSISGALGSGADEDEFEDEGREPMSVVKMQIGLLGTARGLQQDLNRMATSTDTSTPSGLHYLLQETVLSLRRNPQYAVYGKSELVKTRGLDNAEAKFNAMSMEERGKFEQETLSNYGGRKSSTVKRVTGDGMNELIVITIIAAVDGKLEPTDISDGESLRANMNLLGSIPKDRLLALEVLWTPQDEGDFFTQEELVTDYPTLNTL